MVETKHQIIVETRGGTVVGIYSDRKDVRVILVDWDEFKDDGRPGVDYALDPLAAMPPDTAELVARAIPGS
jgi:hypothetical protein